MKKLFKGLAIVLFSVILLTAFKAPDPVVGRWKGKDKGDVGYLTLDGKGYATFEFNGQTMGGEEYDHADYKASMTYITNRNVTPNTIDFIIINKADKQELGRLEGIFELSKNGKELKMAIGFGGTDRPTNYEVDAIMFNKVK